MPLYDIRVTGQFSNITTDVSIQDIRDENMPFYDIRVALQFSNITADVSIQDIRDDNMHICLNI